MFVIFFGAMALVLPSVRESFWLIALVVGIFVVALGLRTKHRIRADQATWGIAVGPDVLRLVTPYASPVEMTRDQVVRALEGPTGLALQAESPPRQIFLPRTVERYDQVRAALVAWKPPEQVGSERGKVVLSLLWQAIGLLAFVGAVFVSDARWAAISTAILLPVLALGVWRVVRERFLPPALRKVAFLSCGVATLAVVGRWALYFYAGSAQ